MNSFLQGVRREWLALLVLIFGAALRFWQLGEFPFHPDEAIHAWFALSLGSYEYNPVYHGPLMYHLNGAAFAIFGVNDFAARVVPAALGTVLLWMVLFPTRRWLGHCGALWAGALIALSPVSVAYSRRLLHDSLVLVLTLGAVLCFAAALENKSTSPVGRRARVGLAVILSLFLATKANVFFIGAMLLAYWFLHLWQQRKSRTASPFDFQTPLFGLLAAAAVYLLLFRADALSAIPEMIRYWGGQQQKPRLPGPNDYYLRLFLLYEIPVFIAGIWGAWCAVRQRSPFTDLVLWWAFSSLVLYGIANEKVPWLLVHQVLPLALLGGYGLARLEFCPLWRRFALGAAVLVASLFSLRHLVATNFEDAADRHEPLLFAQTTASYRDAIRRALESTRGEPSLGIWAAPGEQWPAAWYLRGNAPILDGSTVYWDDSAPSEKLLRVVMISPEDWQVQQANWRFQNWNSSTVERYVWPRPAWSALRPRTFLDFWLHREASRDNGVLAEESSALSVVATRSEASH